MLQGTPGTHILTLSLLIKQTWLLKRVRCSWISQVTASMKTPNVCMCKWPNLNLVEWRMRSLSSRSTQTMPMVCSSGAALNCQRAMLETTDQIFAPCLHSLTEWEEWTSLRTSSTTPILSKIQCLLQSLKHALTMNN